MTEAEAFFREQFLRGDLTYDATTGQIWRHRLAGLLLKSPKLANSATRSGYLRLSWSSPGRARSLEARQHRVIWETFVGPIPPGYQINHKDLDKKNNRLENLEVVTPKENVRHAVAAGCKFGRSGEIHHRVKISDAQLLEIRDQYMRGNTTLKAAAEKYGMERHALYAIFAGKTRGLFKKGGTC